MNIFLLIFTLIFSAVSALLAFYSIRVLYFYLEKRREMKKINHEKFWPNLDKIKPNLIEFNLNWADISIIFVKKILFISLLFILILVFLFNSIWIIFLYPILIGLLIAIVILRKKRRRYLFIQQLPNALDALAQFQKAGYSLQSSVLLLKKETIEPISLVFGTLERANKYDLDFQSAIEIIGIHLQLKEWDIVSNVLRIQHNFGGNIIPIISDISRTLRENAIIDQDIKSATAHGRLSGTIIAMFTPLSLIILTIISPSYIDIFINTTIGRLLLIVAVVLQLFGFLVIKKITSFKY